MRAPWDRTLEPPEDILKDGVPPDPSTRRSLRELLAYMGPALMVSIVYMDPGNYGTDLAAGAGFRYDLIWAVWLASVMAMILQDPSGKLGIVSGSSLPELVRESLGRRIFIIPVLAGRRGRGRSD